MPSKAGKTQRHRLQTLASRWGIEARESELFKAFRSRFLMLVEQSFLWSNLRTDGTERQFALIVGDSMDVLGPEYPFESARTLPEFLSLAQQLIWAMEESRSFAKEEFLRALQQAKNYSPGIDFSIVRRGDTTTIYPRGASELDSALVEAPLEWLSPYPKVAEHFEEALKIVLAKDAGKYRNAMDNLRWSLEQLLKSILRNRKPIEKQNDTVLPWLRARGFHQQVVNMYLDLLKRFTQYQNDAVKHGDEWKEAELEFVIYVTGAFMRLLLQADQMSAAN
jgi:hypothetical protein